MKTSTEISLILEALSTCAIEGNELAERLIDLSRTNPEQFAKEVDLIFPEDKTHE
jgi:hypothetical protein